ncbi:MAG: oxygen-independent coproporphyrinogen III oxidase [Fibrella sp.]|nr:oxygen-independent coproporphyrinogen III oxidase [Armatimonadota bacterium]
MQTAGIYIHIPFCTKKCGYCDFNAYSGYKDATKARYVDALCREIENRADSRTHIPTIFFGGGTPTVLTASDLVRILNTVRQNFTVAKDAEVSTEANPSDADENYLRTLREAGFNRLSFGVQTFDDRLLRTIDRVHSGQDAVGAIEKAKRAGFTNLSIDLMFGLPRQTLADFDRSLDAAFALEVPHLSIYGLIVEERTPFHARRERGKLPLPSENVETAMFARAMERTAEAGFRRYEISNYARTGFESRHNQIYWRNESYFGFGAGAAAYLGGVRSLNEKHPVRYADLAMAGNDPTVERESLTRIETMGETMMVGLRLAEGVDLTRFAERFGVRAEAQFSEAVARQVAHGLLENTGSYLRLTERGVFLASEVMTEFV